MELSILGLALMNIARRIRVSGSDCQGFVFSHAGFCQSSFGIDII